MSKFDLTVSHIPGKENFLADVMSRWAYPASVAERDISKHGNEKDDLEMKEIIRQERLEENECDVTQGEVNHYAMVSQGGRPPAKVAPVEAKDGSYPDFRFKKAPQVGPRPNAKGKHVRPDETSRVNPPRLGR